MFKNGSSFRKFLWFYRTEEVINHDKFKIHSRGTPESQVPETGKFSYRFKMLSGGILGFCIGRSELSC